MITRTLIAAVLVGCAGPEQLPSCSSLGCDGTQNVPLFCVPEDCGEPPQIDDTDYWADPDPNRGHYWCMESDSYYATRVYVASMRRWSACMEAKQQGIPAGSCFCAAPDSGDQWCAP